MACDLCGKASHELQPVADIYRTSEVQSICPDCEKAANKQIFKIRHSTNALAQNLIKEWMKNKFKEWRGK